MHPISAGTAFKQPSFEALQREAAQLGAKIKLVRGFRLLGAWEADTGTIYIREGLPSPERECVLAHELEHAIRGDVGPQSPETEAWIDIEVARRFVDPWEYTCAEKSGWVFFFFFFSVVASVPAAARSVFDPGLDRLSRPALDLPGR